MSHTLIAVYRIATFVLLFYLWSGSAIAQLKVHEQVNTPRGPLLIRDGRGPDCAPFLNHAQARCMVIMLGRDKLFVSEHTGLSTVHPNRQSPQLIVVSTHPGGNANPTVHHVIDLTSSPSIILEDVAYGAMKVFGAARGVVIEKYVDDDEFGDPLFGLYRYEYGSAKMVLESKAPVYARMPLREKKHPFDLIGDPVARAPLLRVMDKKAFKAFRFKVAVGGDMTWIFQRFLVGEGCQPHSCGSTGGFFILDTLRDRAWIVERDNGKGRIWGILEEDDNTPRRLIREWLGNHRMSLRDLVAESSPDSASGMPPLRGPVLDAASGFDTSGRVGGLKVINAADGAEMQPVALFETVAPSLYVLRAKGTLGGHAQGSAVAVSREHLLTNCHVLRDSVEFTLHQGEQQIAARLIAADVEADRCVLQTSSPLKSFVQLRAYAGTKIGERLFSIGAPYGLELTFADGLLSGKRTHNNQRYVQTTASISAGSSGGGLFDARGHLVGITTFRLRDAQSLNFAIAADEFVR